MKNPDDNIHALENQPILKLLVKYSIPAIAGMVVYSLYNVIDSIFIGQWLGATALSGLAIAFPVMTLTFALGTLVGIGGAAICSIRLGEKNLKEAHFVLGNVLFLSLFLGITFGWTACFFLEPLLKLFGASEATLPHAYKFMQITLLALPCTFSFFNLNHIMRASGYPQKAMCSTLISAGINIILAPIFIKLFDWGMYGAAFATMFAQILSSFWIIAHFFQRKSILHFQRHIFKIQFSTIKSIVAIGLSPCMMNTFACLIVVIINNILLKHGGDMAVGAYGNLSRVLILMAMVVVGITQGMQPIIGYNHGAGKTDRVRKTLRYGIVAGSTVTFFGALICITFPSLISHLFTTQKELLDLTDEALRLSSLAFPFVGAQIVIGNFFQAIGKAKLSIFLSTTRQMLFLVPLLFILPQFLGRQGVWLSMPISDFISFILNVVLLIFFLKNYNAVPADLAGSRARETLPEHPIKDK